MNDFQIFSNTDEQNRFHKIKLLSQSMGLILFNWSDVPEYFYLYNGTSRITTGSISHMEDYLERLSKIKAFL